MEHVKQHDPPTSANLPPSSRPCFNLRDLLVRNLHEAHSLYTNTLSPSTSIWNLQGAYPRPAISHVQDGVTELSGDEMGGNSPGTYLESPTPLLHPHTSLTASNTLILRKIPPCLQRRLR